MAAVRQGKDDVSLHIEKVTKKGEPGQVKLRIAAGDGGAVLVLGEGALGRKIRRLQAALDDVRKHNEAG